MGRMGDGGFAGWVCAHIESDGHTVVNHSERKHFPFANGHHSHAGLKQISLLLYGNGRKVFSYKPITLYHIDSAVLCYV